MGKAKSKKTEDKRVKLNFYMKQNTIVISKIIEVPISEVPAPKIPRFLFNFSHNGGE